MASATRPEPHRHARHRRPRRRTALAVTAAGVLGTLAASGAVALVGAGLSGGSADGTDCPDVRTLRVAAAPEVARAVTRVAGSLTALGCTRVEVSAADPAATAASVAAGTAAADVWIPDSSVWLAGLADRPAPVSLASTPAVLAVPVRAARGLGGRATYARIGHAATAAHPVVLRTASPERSAAAQAVLSDLATSLRGTAAGRGDLAALIRSADLAAPAPAAPARRGAVATASTEQAVRTANRSAGRTVLRAVGPASGGTSLDFPYVVLSTDPAQTGTAQWLLDGLTAPAGRAALERAGLRAGGEAPASVLTAAASAATLRTVALVERPTRTLALVDVSGSMATPVPGAAGASRMDLARAALRRGMGMLPDGTVAGLWRFSAELTPTTDYQRLAPMTLLDGRTRQALGSAVDTLAVDPDGGTGLYASTLAAVREVRRTYDPTRVNSVIVLSDGRDQDATAHAVGLDRLLATLRAEADPRRPVIVVSIAYGPNSDEAAMRAISEATGGTLYTATDPRDLPVILRQAIGARLG